MKRILFPKKDKKAEYSKRNYKNNKELSDYDKDIIKFLDVIARRKFFQNLLNYMSWGICIGAFLAFILNLLSLFVPVYNADIYGFYIIVASFIISFIYGIIRYPSLYDAALYADAAGLKEKLVTSLELAGTSGGFSALLKEDALSEIEKFDKRLRLPIIYPWKRYITVCLFISMFVVCVFIPAQAKLDAEKIHKLALQADEVKDKVEKAQKALDKAMKDEETKEEAENIKEILKQTKKELSEAKDSSDIRKAEERLANKLKEELEKAVEKDNSNSTDNSQKLIDAMQSLVPDIDLTQLANYNKKLSELAESNMLSESALNELKSLGEMLTKEQIEKLLENLEKSMEDGEISDDELKEALESTGSADAQMALASITDMQASQSSSEASQSSGSSGEAQAGAAPSGESQSAGQNGSAGSSGEGSSGEGSGTGQNGTSSSGTGTGNGSNGGNGSGIGGGWNMGSETGLERESTGGKAENVFVTDMETGDDENLTGRKSGEGKITEKTNQSGSAMAGSKADLDSVVGDYSSQAYSKVNSGQVPAAMKDVVKNYFSGLSK